MTHRILVVDDSTTIQKIFQIALSRHETEVVVASSVVEAKNEILKQPPKLLVVDATLKGSKDPEFVRRLQQDAGGAPVLLLIGSHEAVDIETFKSSGLNHFLKKPFEVKDILREVALVLGGEIPRQADPEEIPTRPSVPAFSGMEVPPPPGAVPLSSVDEDAHEATVVSNAERRGQPAFSTPPDKVELNLEPPPVSQFASEPTGAELNIAPPMMSSSSSGFDEGEVHLQIKQRLEDFITGEVPLIVKKTVEDYCQKHFAELARDVLTSELRRLAEEKSRLLADH